MEPYACEEIENGASWYSSAWFPRNTAPSSAVSASHRTAPDLSLRSPAFTAPCMVKLEAISTSVATAVRPFASSTPTGGHGLVLARSVNHAANSPLKNISSEASHTTTPIARGVGRRRTSSAPVTAAMGWVYHNVLT